MSRCFLNFQRGVCKITWNIFEINFASKIVFLRNLSKFSCSPKREKEERKNFLISIIKNKPYFISLSPYFLLFFKKIIILMESTLKWKLENFNSKKGIKWTCHTINFLMMILCVYIKSNQSKMLYRKSVKMRKAKQKRKNKKKNWKWIELLETNELQLPNDKTNNFVFSELCDSNETLNPSLSHNNSIRVLYFSI